MSPRKKQPVIAAELAQDPSFDGASVKALAVVSALNDARVTGDVQALTALQRELLCVARDCTRAGLMLVSRIETERMAEETNRLREAKS